MAISVLSVKRKCSDTSAHLSRARTGERALPRIRAAGAGNSSCRGTASAAMRPETRMAAVPAEMSAPKLAGDNRCRGSQYSLRTLITQ